MEETVVKEAMETTATVAQEAAQDAGTGVNLVTIGIVGLAVFGLACVGYHIVKKNKTEKDNSVKPANEGTPVIDAETVKPEVSEEKDNVNPETLN